MNENTLRKKVATYYCCEPPAIKDDDRYDFDLTMKWLPWENSTMEVTSRASKKKTNHFLTTEKPKSGQYLEISIESVSETPEPLIGYE